MSGRKMKKAVREALGRDTKAVRDYRSALRAGLAKSIGLGVVAASVGLLVTATFYCGCFYSAARNVIAVSGLASVLLFVLVVKPETDCLFFWMLKGNGAISGHADVEGAPGAPGETTKQE